MWQVATVNEAFLKVSGRGEQVVWRWQDKDGSWKPITAAGMYGRVRALATALASWGVVKGDRVALLSENRWEWPVTDFAVLALGAVDVPLYHDADRGAGGLHAARLRRKGRGGLVRRAVPEAGGGRRSAGAGARGGDG